MNSVNLDILSPRLKLQFQTDIENALSDPQYCTTLVLRKRGSQTFDPTTGISTHSWTNTITYAIKSSLGTTEMPSGKGYGVMEFGDIVFLISLKDKADVVSLDKDDRILELQYDKGAVSVTKGSKAVTGDTTEWAAYGSQGDLFKLKQEPLSYLNEVASISTNTALALTSNYAGETKVNQQYQLWHEYFVVGVETDTWKDLVVKYIVREIK